MIERIIAFSVRNKLIIAIFTIFIIAGGIWSLTKVPIDAVPDITNNQVQVITRAPNLGAGDVEQFITYPVELSMANLPGVTELRSVSRFGLSVVTIVFEDDMGTYLPRQLVKEKLDKAKKEIPSEFGDPFIGPISTGLSEIYQYSLEVDSAYEDEYSLSELRSIQDWIVSRQMALVPGVVEVNGFGGHIKQYEVAVNPNLIHSMDLSLADVFRALEVNNQNSGGAYIEKNHKANFIRVEGLARSLDDIRNMVVSTKNGIPVLIKDIAEVSFGEAIRYGAFTKNGKGEAVGGMILMLKGANSNKVITAVKERVEQIQLSLPDGIRIKPFLDRSDLISRTTSTVRNNLMEGALIVIFVLVFLLGNWRGGLIVASTIPLSLLFAFILMNLFDVWANLMSLGAIDFGIIVDGAVIIVEGTVFYLAALAKKGKNINAKKRDEVTEKSASRMMKSAFFGQLIILLVFVPILFLEGVEGKMFKPMALTFMFAMIGAIILCLTYVPMLSAAFIRIPAKSRDSLGDRLIKWVENVYEKALQAVLKRPLRIILVSLALLGLSAWSFQRMGGEFIPQLDEGDIAFHVILKPGSALSETVKACTGVERILLEEFPEIDNIVSRIGVAEVPTDPMPMDIADVIVSLKDPDEWTSADDKEELIDKMKASLVHLPGLTYEFTQPIEMRFNELLTGVREDVAIKLYGEDMTILADRANQIGALIAGIPGVADHKVEATSGQPQITVHYQRDQLARYGLNVKQVNRIVQTAFAGSSAGLIFEGERRYDLMLRLDREYRSSLQDVEDLYINTPDGSQIPLRTLAKVQYEPGPMQISRDNTNRRTSVGVNVRGRDVKSVVEDIRTKLESELQLPAGYYIRYGGAFENFERASKRLRLVVPATLLLIFLLIFFAIRSVKQSLMIFIAIPLAAIGGVFALWLRDMPFSISAGVGFIVLFGVAVLNGLVLINGWNELRDEEEGSLMDRITKGARRRIRPILLTALTDIFGFLPMALSMSAGAEVQRPLATVVIGGLISSSLLTLFVLPVLYQWIEKRSFLLKPAGISAVFLVGGLLSAPLFSSGQTADSRGIDMQTYIERATLEYPAMQARQKEVERAQLLRKSNLQIGSTRLFNAAEEVDRQGEGVVTGLGFQQQNFRPFSMGAALKKGDANYELIRSGTDLYRAKMSLQLKRDYAATLLASLRLKQQKKVLESYKTFEKAARLNYELEISSRLTLMSANGKLRQAELNFHQAEYELEIAIAYFNKWIGDSVIFYPADSLEYYNPIDTLRNPNHVAVAVGERQLDLARTNSKFQKAQLLPAINAQYGRQSIEGEAGYYQYQIGLSIPLINPRQRAQYRAARVGVEIAEMELRAVRRNYQAAWQAALANYLKTSRSWEYYREEGRALAEEQRRSALLMFREGAIDYLELITHLEEASATEMSAIDAFENYLNACFELEFYSN